jgi:hypothetical protein
MSSDPGDLANLADLAVPQAISYWPPAPGVWIVAGAAAAMLLVAGWRAPRRYRADAYLRRALAELDALPPAGAGRDEALSAILKRVAIVAYGRARVASLTGAAWAGFIAQTAPSAGGAEILAARLAGLLAQPDGAGDPDPALAQAKAWLEARRGQRSRRA